MDNRRDVLPSDKSAIAEAERLKQEKRERNRVLAMREDFTRTFKTEHGKRVLAWLRDRCGHNKIILSANSGTGSLDPMMTMFAAMELNLYLEVRKNLPTSLLQEIEYGAIDPSGVLRDDDGDNGTVTRTGSTRTKRSRQSQS